MIIGLIWIINIALRLGKPDPLCWKKEKGLRSGTSMGRNIWTSNPARWQMGALLKTGLEKLQTKFEVVGDVRGKGLFLGLEIIESKDSRHPDPARTLKLVTECENRGLLLGGGIPTGGLGTNTVRLCPPLVIKEKQVGAAISILEKE